MPTPSTPKILKINVTSGIKGQAITIRNRTTAEKVQILLGVTGGALFDVQNLTSGFSDGDVIDIKVGGEVIGTGSVTLETSDALVDDDPQEVTISTSAITSGLIRGI